MTASYSDRLFGVSSSLAVKAPVVAATTANITLSGLQTVDGVALSSGDRVLVKAQTNPVMNGIWVADLGDWARAVDFNGARDATRGTFVLVIGGDVVSQAVYTLTTDDPVIGLTSLTFEPEFSSGASESAARAEAAAGVSRADMVALIAGGFVPAADVTYNVGGYRYIGVTGSTLMTAFGLAGLEPLAPYHVQQWGAVTYPTPTGGDDYTAEIQAAVDWCDGDLIFDGWVHVTDQITCNNKCRVHVPAGRAHGGLTVTSTFNMSADCVLRPGTSEPAATVGEFGIWFAQPQTPASRSDLRQYPPAVDIADLARGKIEALRILNAWDGIVGIGNFGGYEFGTVEVGCFNKWCDLDGALDFVRMGSWHVWWFGYSGNALLTAIASATPPTGTIGRIDSMKANSFGLWRSRLTLSDTGGSARLPYQIDAIALDGDKSSLTLGVGPSQIGQIYATNSAAGGASDRQLIVSGAGHHISAYQCDANADAAILVQSGGEVTIGHGDFIQLNAGRRAAIVQSGGRLDIGALNVRAHGAAAAARTAHCIRQESGGILSIGNLRIHPDVSTSSVPVVSFATDEPGNFLGARGVAIGYTFDLPVSRANGFYDVRQGVPNAVARAPIKQTVANDGVMIINLGSDKEVSQLTVIAGATGIGTWRARAAATPALTAMGTVTGLSTTTGALTGTTGGAGVITVSVAASGLYYVQNRTGSSVEVMMDIAG